MYGSGAIASGNIPVYSRNELRHGLHSDRAELSGSHTWPRKNGHYRVNIEHPTRIDVDVYWWYE